MIDDRNPDDHVYFWGAANGEPGLYLWHPDMTMVKCYGISTPFGPIDGLFTPGSAKITYDRRPPETGPPVRRVHWKEQIEGDAAMHYRHGWTILAWWDRSVDKRFGCNAAIVALGRWSFEGMMYRGSKFFPDIMRRFKYKIRLTGITDHPYNSPW